MSLSPEKKKPKIASADDAAAAAASTPGPSSGRSIGNTSPPGEAQVPLTGPRLTMKLNKRKQQLPPPSKEIKSEDQNSDDPDDNRPLVILEEGGSNSAPVAGPSTRQRTPKLLTQSLLCDLCNQLQGPTRAHLEQHLKTAHGVNGYRCLLAGCNGSFESLTTLWTHYRTAHSSLPHLTCATCNRHFDDHFSLHQHHFRIHEQGHFTCAWSGCTFSAPTRKAINTHFESHRAYQCSYPPCTRVFTRAFDRLRHEKIHLGIHPYTCPWPNCNAAFRYSHYLRPHLYTHRHPNGPQPYRCKWQTGREPRAWRCLYGSEVRSSVLTHIKRVHLKLPVGRRQKELAALRGDPVSTIDPKIYLEDMLLAEDGDGAGQDAGPVGPHEEPDDDVAD